jgi:HK97 family phage major capsid protein
MSDILNKLRDRRLNVWEQAKSLADAAAEANRAFDATEETTWTALNAEIQALDTRMTAILEGEKRAKDAEDSYQSLMGKPADKAGKPADENATSTALRAFLTGNGPRAYEATPDGPVDFRVLSKLTAGAGANTVPTGFYNRLMAHLIESSAMLQAGPTVLSTGSGESIQVPKTTAHSSAALVSPQEGGTIAPSDPAFGQLTLGAFKYGTLIQISNELLTDTGVDLEGYLSMQVGRALGNAFGTHMVTGDGTAKPRGVVTDATLGITGGTGVAGAFTADNLIDLHYSVIAPYRASSSCMWIMKDSTVANVRKLKDSSQGYLWQPSLQLGAPDMILGKPVLTDPNVAAVALSAKSVLFGDFSQYFVRLVSGVRFERSDDFAFSTDLVTFRALLRADAALVDLTGAVKFFAGNAA